VSWWMIAEWVRYIVIVMFRYRGYLGTFDGENN